MGEATTFDLVALIGKTMTDVYKAEVGGNDAIVFEVAGGEKFALFHDQDCCESVYLEDLNGDLADLVGSPILQAYEASSEEDRPPPNGYAESFTWTFYHLSTVKGTVSLRWFGESNGYYSEDVQLHRFDPSHYSSWGRI